MDFDRYPALSTRKSKVADHAAVLEVVRRAWPDAVAQGAMGYERTWIAEVGGRRRIVAHSWSPKASMDWFWVRIASDSDDTLDDDAPGLTPRELASAVPGEVAELLASRARRARRQPA